MRLRLKTQVIGLTLYDVSKSTISENDAYALGALPDQKVIPFRSGNKASQQLLSPLDRDLRLFPFGMVLVESRLFNGLDGYSWFANEAAAVDYLRTAVWLELGYSADDECIARSFFRYAFRDTSCMRWDRLDQINAEQDELQVLWFGSFTNLLNANDAFAKSVVADFQKIKNVQSTIIDDCDVNGFIEHLQSYRSIMPPHRTTD